MNKIIAKIAMAAMLAAPLFGALPLAASADSVGPIDFENPPYTLGVIDAQDGWNSDGAAGSGCAVYDHAVSSSLGTAGFGAQSLRISNAVTSGCFGDQTFAKPLVNAAGEADSTDGSFSRGTLQSHFEAQFELASTIPGAEQPGLFMSVSPDRGDGSRMSYLGFSDEPTGIDVIFYDVQGTGNPANFVLTDLGIVDRSVPHTFKFVMDFADGASNDVVKIYIDGVLVHTGTSWENYYRNDSEASAEQSPRIVKTLIFRTGGGAVPANAGNGYLVDNLTLSSDDDDDGDGVLNSADFCPGTLSDVGSWDPGPLGTNRWELNGDLDWQQNKSKGGLSVSPTLDVSDTYGCSGQQILDLVSALTGEDMDGHYKYGLSTSVLNEFIEDGKDGVIDGINSNSPIETVVVPADDADGVSSAASLALGKNYKLKASGTADACVSGCGYSIIFDPEYSTSNSGTTWEDGVAAPYNGFGPDLLDLKVNGGFVNWDNDAVYNADHTYWSSFAGAGAAVNFLVNDLFYGNNTGSLTVDIFVQLY